MVSVLCMLKDFLKAIHKFYFSVKDLYFVRLTPWNPYLLFTLVHNTF